MDLKEHYVEMLEQGRRDFDRHYEAFFLGAFMVDSLKRGGFFDDMSHFGFWPAEHTGQDLTELTIQEGENELEFRRKAVRHYIHHNGLAPFRDRIIKGMNKTCRRVIIMDDSLGTKGPLQARDIIHHDSSALLRFALDYVDRWKMYNDMFGLPSGRGS